MTPFSLVCSSLLLKFGVGVILEAEEEDAFLQRVYAYVLSVKYFQILPVQNHLKPSPLFKITGITKAW